MHGLQQQQQLLLCLLRDFLEPECVGISVCNRVVCLLMGCVPAREERVMQLSVRTGAQQVVHP